MKSIFAGFFEKIKKFVRKHLRTFHKVRKFYFFLFQNFPIFWGFVFSGTKKLKKFLGSNVHINQIFFFLRQVIACTTDPSLLKTNLYPEDVKQKALSLLGACGGGSVGLWFLFEEGNLSEKICGQSAKKFFSFFI